MLGYTKSDNEKMVERLSKFGVGSEVGTVGARIVHAVQLALPAKL